MFLILIFVFSYFLLAPIALAAAVRWGNDTNFENELKNELIDGTDLLFYMIGVLIWPLVLWDVLILPKIKYDFRKIVFYFFKYVVFIYFTVLYEYLIKEKTEINKAKVVKE